MPSSIFMDRDNGDVYVADGESRNSNRRIAVNVLVDDELVGLFGIGRKIDRYRGAAELLDLSRSPAW
jgi:hypothetical protein